MKTYLAVLILSAVVSFVLTPFVRRMAFVWNAVDHPNEDRKIHDSVMPRLGGLAVFVGFSITWIGFYVVENRVALQFQNYEKLLFVLMVGASMMILLGIYDDIKGADARKKLAVQLVAAVTLVVGGFRIETLSNPFGGVWELGWLSYPVSLLWIVGITNAMNLLDGLDGLATGVTACISLSLAIVNIFADNIIVSVLTLSLAGACLGFLPYNFYPAKIFLGDTGSLFIGIVLACIGIISLFKAATATLILAPILMFGLPMYDTLSVMIRRIARGAPVFQADKTHVHHRLLRLGWSQKQIAFGLYVATSAMGLFSVLITLRQEIPLRPLAGAAAGLLALVAVLAYRKRRL